MKLSDLKAGAIYELRGSEYPLNDGEPPTLRIIDSGSFPTGMLCGEIPIGHGIQTGCFIVQLIGWKAPGGNELEANANGMPALYHPDRSFDRNAELIILILNEGVIEHEIIPGCKLTLRG